MKKAVSITALVMFAAIATLLWRTSTPIPATPSISPKSTQFAAPNPIDEQSTSRPTEFSATPTREVEIDSDSINTTSPESTLTEFNADSDRITSQETALKDAEAPPYGESGNSLRSSDLPTTNGLHYFLKASESLKPEQSELIREKWDELGPDAWNDPEIQALFEHSQDLFDLIQQGISAGNIENPLLQNGPDELMPYLQNFRSIGRLLAMESRRLADLGYPASALEHQILAVQFANESSNGGTIIGGLVGYNMSEASLQEIVHIANESSLPLEDYQYLIAELQDIDARIQTAGHLQYSELESMSEWFENEFAKGNTLRNMLSENPDLFDFTQYTDPQLNAFYAEYKQDLVAMSQHYSQPFYLIDPAARQAFDPNNPFSTHLIPDLNALAIKTAQHQAQVRGTLTQIAIQSYAATTGAFPPNLNALVPNYLAALPTDPFTGQPLIYQSTQTGDYTLQSAGPQSQEEPLIFR